MPSEVTVLLPDGSARSVPDGTTIAELAAGIGRRLAAAAVAAELDGVLVDLSSRLVDGANVRIVTADTDEGREVFATRRRTSSPRRCAGFGRAHVTRSALPSQTASTTTSSFPRGARFSEDDLSGSRQRCGRSSPSPSRSSARSTPLPKASRSSPTSPTSARSSRGSPRSSSGSTPSWWPKRAGIRRCQHLSQRAGVRGPVPRSPRALDRPAGALQADPRGRRLLAGRRARPQLQRVYGTAWESDKALEAHLHRLEEAERRDHRRLGAELDLFSFPTELGSGLAVFHPKGGLVRKVMEDYSRARHDRGRATPSSTRPHITRSDLFETSGTCSGSPRACSLRWSSTRGSATT